jgi:hypothetical protein
MGYNPENYLVGGDWNHGILNDFPIIWGIIIIPTDELTFFRGVVKPPTSYGFIETATGVTNIKP